MKKSKLLALIMIPAFIVSTFAGVMDATTVSAGEQCRYVPGTCYHMKHYSPDTGYDADIIGTCDWGNNRWDRAVRIKEGKWDGCVDLDGVYVRSNEEIWCRQYVNHVGMRWIKRWDSPGWHQLHSWTARTGSGCVVQRD